MSTLSEHLLLAVIPFAVSSTFTPGPNNLMVMAAAANFGYVRTIPHMIGISVGFPLMVVGVGLGLAPLFEHYPATHIVLKIAGAAYLLYLAWRIANAAPGGDGQTRSRPFRFYEAALFQWVNPKAWIMAMGAIATYTTIGGDLIAETLTIAGVFLAITYPAVSLWAGIGLGIARILAGPRAMRLFNQGMALLLVVSLAPIFF